MDSVKRLMMMKRRRMKKKKKEKERKKEEEEKEKRRTRKILSGRIGPERIRTIRRIPRSRRSEPVWPSGKALGW